MRYYFNRIGGLCFAVQTEVVSVGKNNLFCKNPFKKDMGYDIIIQYLKIEYIYALSALFFFGKLSYKIEDRHIFNYDCHSGKL